MKPLDRKAIEWIREDFDAVSGRFSPDGHLMAYLSNEVDALTTQLYLRTPTGSALQVTSLKGGANGPTWRQDGRKFFS